MIRLLFDAFDNYQPSDFANYDAFMAVCSGFYTVTLEDEEQLLILFKLLGIQEFTKNTLPGSDDFSCFYESRCYLPEFNLAQFDEFYEQWLAATQRQASMQEYGQLVFIQGQAQSWNSKGHLLVLLEAL